jgi:hypothetical protein
MTLRVKSSEGRRERQDTRVKIRHVFDYISYSPLYYNSSIQHLSIFYSTLSFINHLIMSAKPRAVRSAAPSASPAPGTSRSSRSRSSKTVDSESTDDDAMVAADEESEAAEAATDGDENVIVEEEEEEEELESGESGSGSAKLSMSERMEKMKELRNRMVSRLAIDLP